MSSYKVAEDRTLTHPQRRGNLQHRQSPLAQCRRPLRLGFRRPFQPPVIDALGLSHRNPCGLPLAAIFPLNLGESKEDTRHHPADRTAEINLLGHRDNPDIVPTPRCEEIDAILLPPCEPIQLPHDDGGDGTRANRPLEAYKGGPTEALPALHIFKPLDCSQVEPLVDEPASELGLLTIGLLRPGRHPTITGNHTAAFATTLEQPVS